MRSADYQIGLTTYGGVYVKSLIFALIATLMCLAIAYPLAYTIAFKSGRWRNILLVLVIAPFFTSFLLRTNAWQTILSDNGQVVRFLENIGVLSAAERHSTPTGSRSSSTGSTSSRRESPPMTECSPPLAPSSSVSPTTSCRS